MSSGHNTKKQPQDSLLPAVMPGSKCSGELLSKLSQRYRVDFMVRWDEIASQCARKDPLSLRNLFCLWVIPTGRGVWDQRLGLPVDARAV